MRTHEELDQAVSTLTKLLHHLAAGRPSAPTSAPPWGGLEARILEYLATHEGRGEFRVMAETLGVTKQKLNHHTHLLSSSGAVVITKDPDRGPSAPPGRHVLVAWTPDRVVRKA